MNELTAKEEALVKEFNEDSQIIGMQTEKFLKLVYPSYLVDKENLDYLIEKDSTFRLESMTFFRIGCCTADKADKIFESVNERFEKLITALHSINIPIAYGIISRNGVTNLVFGVHSSNDVESVKTITQGMLSGIDLEEFTPNFSQNSSGNIHHGILAGVPSLYVKEQKQTFSLASIMRSLNGQNYTLLFIAKPISQDIVSQNIAELINVRDKAFAISKRNVAHAQSYALNSTETYTHTDTENNILKQIIISAVGAVIGGALVPGIGAVIGSNLANLLLNGKSHSDSISTAISKTITDGKTISGDIQNGFALELMNYADNAIERLKGGQNNGVWQTAIAYSAENVISRNIIRACLSGELSKLDAEKLPMLAFEPKSSSEVLTIPNFLDTDYQNPLCSYINSAELGLLCTVPTESVPDFELRMEKQLPLLASRNTANEIQIGNVADGKRSMENMPFGLSEQDLNKHTFVCGITGSGKTTTVKKILVEAKKPFLVIESAKKEYRNINLEDTLVFTPGKPEVNAPQINPFYIMPGVSPQVHIDYLKDLFNASFAFYGPMPYILEKCLHSVYKKKGWDLTLGYHPLLANTKSPTDFFSIEYINNQYSKISHKYLFPTMQDLKDEIERYIEEELKYDGEVAGNVKTAMKVRLENLCVGAKGYTFNTSEFLDIDTMLKKNVVFELEGLADDSDKAFSVGLLVIFINEYRQIQKEISGNQKNSLQHLLVIEEAHRLLKNSAGEHASETVGDAKGKAVEHFTNMLAEMRSYGQGVIVAEQIPTKIAPDVIKNSSTKIVQRIVSADDQQTMANTIGLANDDAVQIGFLESGFAYCHKEGMVLPTPVKISDYYTSSTGKQSLDVFVSDEELYNHNTNRFAGVNLSVIRSFLGNNLHIKKKIIAFLNTIMVENGACCVKSCDTLMKFVENELKQKDIRLVLTNNSAHLVAKFLTEEIITMMVRGVYCAKKLPDDNFIDLLETTLYAPSLEKVKKIKENMQALYVKDLAKYAQISVAALIKCSMKNNTDIPNTIREYFINASYATVGEIEKILKGS